MSREGEPAREVDDYHYVFSADCKPYMEWQSVALYYSWVSAGAPGRFTRLLSCDEPNYPLRQLRADARDAAVHQHRPE